MEKISGTDRVRNEVLHTVKEKSNILQTIKRGKGNRIGYILRRDCFLGDIIERKIEGRLEMTGRRGRRRKQLVDGLKEKRGHCKLKQAAVDCTWEKLALERGCGSVGRQSTV
jgi:hypothetical protein